MLFSQSASVPECAEAEWLKTFCRRGGKLSFRSIQIARNETNLRGSC